MTTSADSSQSDLQHLISDHAFINITRKYETKIESLSIIQPATDPRDENFCDYASSGRG